MFFHFFFDKFESLATANTPPVFKDGNGTTIGTLCRAWVNFNGTGTVAIRASFNVSSITDNGTGDYTVNFTNAMPDANYAFSGAGQRDNAGSANNDVTIGQIRSDTARTTTSCRIGVTANFTVFDAPSVMVAFFR